MPISKVAHCMHVTAPRIWRVFDFWIDRAVRSDVLPHKISLLMNLSFKEDYISQIPAIKLLHMLVRTIYLINRASNCMEIKILRILINSRSRDRVSKKMLRLIPHPKTCTNVTTTNW